MSKRLAIRGHATRGKEVIEILEMLGGKSAIHGGAILDKCVYPIIEGVILELPQYKFNEFVVFTLEEFLEKYPYKVGDKIIDIADGDSGIITAMKWDEDVSDMKYRVAFDNGDMGWYTNDTIKFLKKDEKLEKGKAMNKKLAIKGHPTRGKEVMELLEMMGGKNSNGFICSSSNRFYYILNEYFCLDYIDSEEIDKYEIFILEEFLEKYPFKVGDKVFLYDNITEGCVTGMKWDEIKGTVKYCVYTSSECWCDVKDLLKWNNVDLVERHYMDNMEEKDKAKAPDIKGEDYSGKRFGYKIPDGYEFDVVVDGKIILKSIKSKYPTNYQECCDVLGLPTQNALKYINKDCNKHDYYNDLQSTLNCFVSLKMCRDAYWKIAGEELRLDKPWEPDWTNLDQLKYCIWVDVGEFITMVNVRGQHILAFPTEEMRDAFYENFKDLIEQCKELL